MPEAERLRLREHGAHNATLANMAGLLFAEVVTTDEAVARLGQGARAAA